MKNPDVKTFFDEATFTATHIVCDPRSAACAIIDPVLDFDASSGRVAHRSANAVLEFIEENDKQVEFILETHAHADHLSAAQYIKECVGGTVAIGSHISKVQEIFSGVFNAERGFETDGRQFDRLIEDGETLKIGGLKLKAMHTPGHTPACMSYSVGNSVFVGDTLFMPDYGTARCDFPGGDSATLYRSIQKLFALPENTKVYLCHDYKAPGRNEFKWQTTVGEEKENNIHVGRGKSETEFVKMRDERDRTLVVPKLILPSVQVNMRAGHFPPPENNGTVYLKIPVDKL